MVSSGLAVSDLAFGYSGRVVGEAPSLALGAGEILCLLGPNGGGKSTLLKTLLGLLRPLRGAITVDGDDTAAWSARRRALAFGYVPQSGGGQFSFTVGEMVLMGRTAHRGVFAAPSVRDRLIAEAALATLGIAGLGGRDWLRLSGGERQLTLIARALAQEARILVLDEPTANLDFGNQVRVLAELREVARRGLAVIFATHHPEQAFACADSVAILHDGRLDAIGPPEAVITPATMHRVYGIEVDIIGVGEGRVKICLPKAWRG
jgi:iron complex transport system ATP-binding protein